MIKDVKSFSEKYPEFRSVLERLRIAETEFNETKKRHESNHKDHPSPKKRTYSGTAGAYGRVSKYYINGAWCDDVTGNLLYSDFIAYLDTILSGEVDKIVIEIWTGKTASARNLYKKAYDITDRAKEVPTPSSSPAPIEESKNDIGHIGQLAEELKSTLREIKSTPHTDDHGNANVALVKMQLEFEKKIDQLEFQAKLKEEKDIWLREKEALQREIDELRQEIEDLNADLDDAEEELSGVAEEAKQKIKEIQQAEKKESALGVIMLKKGEQILTNVLRNNPAIFEVGLGLSKEDIKKMWDKNDQYTKTETKNPTEDTSSFSSADDDIDLSGITEAHSECLKSIVQVSKDHHSEEQIRKLYTLFASLHSEQGKLDDVMLDSILKIILESKNKNN